MREIRESDIKWERGTVMSFGLKGAYWAEVKVRPFPFLPGRTAKMPYRNTEREAIADAIALRRMVPFWREVRVSHGQVPDMALSMSGTVNIEVVGELRGPEN